MGTISNDFVTITYNNEAQEKMANYYMMYFNLEPRFYKGLLNGLDTIKGHELRKFKINENKFVQNYEKHRYSIINTVLKLTSAKHPFFECCGGLTPSHIYYDVLGVKSREDKEEYRLEMEYFDLALDHFIMTGDFKYFKKYLYEEEIDVKAIEELCNNKILHHFPQLLRAKMEEDKYSLQRGSYRSLKENLDYILSIVPIISMVSEEDEELEEYYSTTKIPTIDEKQFDKLVIGSLNHIDPTNKLVEKYLDLKENGRIIKKPSTGDEISNYNGISDTIELYTKGNLEDVIVFVHEFGHRNHSQRDMEFDIARMFNEDPSIFSEYPSIYYEMKTAEYLKQAGYKDEEVNAAQKFRAINNNHNINFILPNLKYLSIVNSELDTYSAIKKVVNHIDEVVKAYSKHVKEKAIDNEEEILKELRIELSCKILEDSGRVVDFVKYLIGTFLADYSIKSVKHEDVLRVLEEINNRHMTLEEIYKMLKDGSRCYYKTKRENIKK